jgi:transglutaminase-like putative cysteine protease
MTPLGLRAGTMLRTVEEGRIIDQVMLWGFAFDVREGQAEWARGEAEQVLERWLGLGLGYATAANGGRLYDPVEVMNFFIAAGRRGEDRFWAERHVATERRRVFKVHGPAAAGRPPSASALTPRRFQVRLQRDYALTGLAPGASARLRFPLPLEDRALGELELKVRAPDGAQVALEPGRLDVRLTVGESRLATLAMDARFVARASVAECEPLSPADRALYVRPKEGMIQVTPRVRAVADSLAGAAADPERKASAFQAFLLDNFACGAVPYDQIDPLAPCEWPLDSGWYDCQMAAALFCALCRAVDLPARMVSGYELYPEVGAYHYWSEAWFEARGWVPFDPTTWHLSMGGRDEAWRSVFESGVDYRMKAEVLPRLFTGPSTIRLPAAWRMLTRLLGEGEEIRFQDARSGALVYRDRIAVQVAAA